MIFSETVVPKGTRLYKGLSIGCRMVPGTTKYFYVTPSLKTARAYGKPCVFYAKKPIRLFQMTAVNLAKLYKYPGISRNTRLLIRLLFGTRTSRDAQAKAYRLLYDKRLPGSKNTRTGQRLSIAELDKLLSIRLTKEFFGPEKFDGYAAPSSRSIFHGGVFRSEIMLCDASKTIERKATRTIERPLIDQARIIESIPTLFIRYCQKHRALMRRPRGFASVYLGGGMAVKLYLKARGKKMPRMVANTSDFDFTFAVNRKLTNVKPYVQSMRTLMTRHITGFLTWLNSTYRSTNVKLIIKDDYVPNIQLLPATKKYVYQVITYRLAFPGREPIDFVDTTLAYVPGASHDHIHTEYSRMFGIPMEKLEYLYRSVAVVLAGSFLFEGIKPRNPLKGRRPEKGLKNAARLAALANYIPRRKGLRGLVDSSRGMLRKIIIKNYTSAKEKAKSVIRRVI